MPLVLVCACALAQMLENLTYRDNRFNCKQVSDVYVIVRQHIPASSRYKCFVGGVRMTQHRNRGGAEVSIASFYCVILTPPTKHLYLEEAGVCAV